MAGILGFLAGSNPALQAVGTGLGILGIAGAANRRRKLDKQLQAQLARQAPTLEIPEAYRQLLGSVDDKISQLGQYQSGEIDRGYRESLSSALAKLNQRGLGSSSLLANFTRANQRDRLQSQLGLREMLLGQRIGAEQNIGLAGLNLVGNERQQLAQMQGGIYNQLAAPTMLSNPFQMFGLG